MSCDAPGPACDREDGCRVRSCWSSCPVDRRCVRGAGCGRFRVGIRCAERDRRQGRRVIAFYEAHGSSARTSDYLWMLALVFFLLFAGSLRSYLRRTPAAVALSSVVLAGAAVLTAGGCVYFGFDYALATVPGHLAPAAAQALNVLALKLFLPVSAGGLVFGTRERSGDPARRATAQLAGLGGDRDRDRYRDPCRPDRARRLHLLDSDRQHPGLETQRGERRSPTRGCAGGPQRLKANRCTRLPLSSADRLVRGLPGRANVPDGRPSGKFYGVEQSVSLVTLGVADCARANAFYRAMGWIAALEVQETTFFQANGVVLVLWGREKLAADTGVSDEGADWSGITLAHNVRSREGVHEVIELARKNGADIAREPADTFYGGYAGVFRDLDGHAWEIAHNPGFALHEDGSVVLPPA